MGTVLQYWKVLHSKKIPAISTSFLYCFGFTIMFFVFLLDAGAAIPVLKMGFLDIVALMFAYMLINLISSLRYVILFKPIRRLSFRQLYLVQMIVRAHSYSLPFIAGYRKSEKIIEDRLRIPAEISRPMIGIDQLIIFMGGIIPALFICFEK